MLLVLDNNRGESCYSLVSNSATPLPLRVILERVATIDLTPSHSPRALRTRIDELPYFAFRNHRNRDMKKQIDCLLKSQELEAKGKRRKVERSLISLPRSP